MPGTWTLYEAQLPAGAKHAAIRSCATNAFLLMIDDVCFHANMGSGYLTLLGYDLYRNGSKVNEQPLSDVTFTDAAAPEGLNTYTVVARYDKGTAAPSNEFELTTSVLSAIDASAVSITSAHGCIVVSGAEGLSVSVAATDGRIVAATPAAASARLVIPAAPGIYVVTAGTLTAKVAVK